MEKKKETRVAIAAPAYRRTIERRAAASTKAMQNKTSVTPEKDGMRSANTTPGGYEFAPLVASQQGERTTTSPLALGYPLLSPSRHVRTYHTAGCSPALAFSVTIHFAMKCSAPCSAVLRYSPSSWDAAVHWSALMPKALRSSRKHPIHSFSLRPT